MTEKLNLGDFNAQHVAWGDEFCNTYGESLFNFCDEKSFIVKSPNEHTFVKRHLNGGSAIDLCLCDFTVCNHLSDFYTALFTGAPSVGHWSVCLSRNLKSARL